MVVKDSRTHERTANRQLCEGFEISVRGLRISLGRAGAMILASAVAGILYAIARSL
jgi:hypothetical protein